MTSQWRSTTISPSTGRSAFKHKRAFGRETTCLFLAEDGEVLSLTGLNNAFRRFSAKTGIKCHPHICGTPSAPTNCCMSRVKTQSQALLWVRDRMGHSSITTTEKYIKIMPIWCSMTMWMAIRPTSAGCCAMAIKRQKLNRKVDLVIVGDNVVDMPPGWTFMNCTPWQGDAGLHGVRWLRARPAWAHA